MHTGDSSAPREQAELEALCFQPNSPVRVNLTSTGAYLSVSAAGVKEGAIFSMPSHNKV